MVVHALFFPAPCDRIRSLSMTRNMRSSVILICLLSIPLFGLGAQEQSNKNGTRVEVVATASEYVPRATTVSHPGHAYSDCSGTTSYFGRFDIATGRLSGTAESSQPVEPRLVNEPVPSRENSVPGPRRSLVEELRRRMAADANVAALK